MKKIVLYGIFGVLVLGGTGTFLYFNNKKKKDAEKEDESSETKKTYSNGILYYGINADQTRALQTKLNEFIQSGKLGDVMGILGQLGETVSSNTTLREFIFVANANDTISYRYRSNSSKPWSSWCRYLSWCPNDGGNKAYERWVQDGKPVGVAYPISGGDGIMDNTTTAAATTTSNTVDVPISTGNAIEQFKAAIQPSLTNNALKVDGAYGKNTMAVVAALQLYLNATKNAGLQVDGKYGPKTDAATGWGLAGLGDLGRKKGNKGKKGKRKKKGKRVPGSTVRMVKKEKATVIAPRMEEQEAIPEESESMTTEVIESETEVSGIL